MIENLGRQEIAFAVPEPGQLVEVRRRQWVVSGVQGQLFNSNSSQHIVTLSALDEDALGEELQVIWQIEPGAKILERAGMPKITGVDSCDKLDAFLDAVRWGAVTNADRSFLQAPFRSGITIEDYQLDPLVRSIDMARVNLLIADDVGLGKTIEAGLVVQELLVRHRARTVLIVCPASLQMKWQTEMWEKFGLEFRIVDTEYIKRLRRERGIHANPWTSFPRLISSMDWMKSGEGNRLMKDCLPSTFTYPRKFDILIVDEAHNVAPATASQYALESQRTRLIRTIAPHFEHRLFLSATPHNGYQESFTSLLELLDDQRFARSIMPNEKQLQRVMVRRLKSDLVDSNGKPLFPQRKLMPLEVKYTQEEREIHELLRAFTRSRGESAKGTTYEYGSEFIHKLLKKRLFSSPMAFAITLAKYRESLGRSRNKHKEKAGLIEEKILRKAILRAEEDFADDVSAENAHHEAMEVAGELAIPLDNAQRSMLDKLTDWAERLKYSIDAKGMAILKWLDDHLKTDGEWNGKRVILFTEYKATQAWLQQIFASYDFGGDQMMVIHGGIEEKERERIKAAFQAHPNLSPVRILLATDAASEGIDLQNHCNYLIHVEIPWNPNVMEQRNGRIDRHGQKEREVFIWHPIGKVAELNEKSQIGKTNQIDGDHEYLMRAVLKINTIRQDLGSVGPVIARQIEEAMLGKRTTLDTSAAEVKAAKARKFVSVERRLQEKIAKLHERLMEAKYDFHLSADRISRAVAIALNLAEKSPLKLTTLPGTPEGTVYEVPLLPGSWGRATAGLEHPHTGLRRPITFDHEVAKGRDDVVLAHLNHRLVQMCLRLLREEIWKLDDIKKLHRVTIKAVPVGDLSFPVVVIHSRLIITGGDYQRLHEEITLSGGELKDSGFVRIPQIGRLQGLLDASTPLISNEGMLHMLTDRFEKQENTIRATMEARSTDRLRSLTSTLSRRKESEISDLMNVLGELEKTIIKELESEGLPRQLFLPGFEEEERNQIQKDIAALKARLERIPSEKELESAAIEKRYADLTDRTFPVAVTFLIPQPIKRG